MTSFVLPASQLHACGSTRSSPSLVRSVKAQPGCRDTTQHTCRAVHTHQTEAQPEWVQNWRTKLAAAGAAAALAFGSAAPAALANEFDILAAPTPTTNYIIDDASVLNRATKKGLNDNLAKLEEETGYRLEVVTVRKLETESDAFSFGDKLIERWYQNVERGSNKGVLVVVTTAKDGAVTGGPAFLKAVGDELIDSVVSENIPILTTEEKFNETVNSSSGRVSAKLEGKDDPGPPFRASTERKRTYKTKGETARVKNVTAPIVGGLLVIAFVVPMVQYFSYTRK